ncbi:MAG: SH3 domain-containing protein [Firmicutes bacterium ADurb.Bin182]|nr:MAG: SH3 domain-containing protein [Firmicutes bacterium ADurb.Bin182]
MKNRKAMKTSILILAVLLVLTASSTAALAITSDPWGFGSLPGYWYPVYSGTMMVLSEANVRKEPTRNSKLLGTLEKGEYVAVYGKQGDWYIISWKNGFAYVYESYFEETYVPSPAPGYPSQGTIVTATTGVNVRSGPGTGYSIVGELEKGDTVEKLGTSGSWTMVRYKGFTAYVYSKYLTGGTVPGGTPSNSALMAATAAVNVRKGPGTNYEKDGWLNKGDKVVKIGTSGSWTKIEWKGGSAYVYSKYLKEDTTGTPAAGGLRYAKADTYIYSGPGSGYTKLAKLNTNQSVTVTGYVFGDWSQIIWDNGVAYVSTSCLATAPVSAVQTTKFTNKFCYVYAGPETNSTVGSLQINEPVFTTGVTYGNRTQIKWGTGVAYVLTSCLTTVPYYSLPVNNTVTASIRRALVNTAAFKGAGTSTAIVVLIAKDDLVSCTGVRVGDWMQVNTEKGYAFVASNCLSDPLYSYPAAAPGSSVMRAKNDTPIYSEPSAAGNMIGLLKKGNQVLVIADLNNGWVLVKLSESSFGYVKSNALE